MSPIVQFLKVLGSLLRSGRMSYGDALTRFRAQFGRPAEGMEKAAIMKEVEKAPSNIVQFPKDRITDWWKPRPGDVKKTDESPLSTLLSKQSKELEGIDQGQGMGFYREMGDMIKKHRREKLELEYDEMYNKILEKAKRIESDPLPLLEAELGKKLTGKETTTQLLEIFKNRPKKASGGIARVGFVKGKLAKGFFEFVDGLWIKASNDIRLGRGKWAGLTEKQRIVQHDNMVKKMMEWQKTKKLPEGAEQYFGIDAKKAFAGATKKVDDEKLMQTAYDEIKGGSGFSGDYKYDADILAEEYARQHGKVYADLPEDQISIYYDPALKRVSQDLLKRREARKALKDVHQKIELQMFDTKGRKPNAYGGIAGELHLNQGGRVSFTKGGKVSSGLAKILGV